MMPTSPALMGALDRARRLGVLGPGPVEAHIKHAQAFVVALQPIPAGSTVVDLGSGAGVPGLILVEARPDLQIVLLDAMRKRTALLEEAVASLAATDRCQVVTGRAEDVGRSALRGTAAAVTARSFGRPAVTAECGSPLLAVSGVLIVSEPPEEEDRWPSEGLLSLGLVPASSSVPGVQILEQCTLCPDVYPRRNGLPAKRPLF